MTFANQSSQTGVSFPLNRNQKKMLISLFSAMLEDMAHYWIIAELELHVGFSFV
jgi:hypothetical protein